MASACAPLGREAFGQRRRFDQRFAQQLASFQRDPAGGMAAVERFAAVDFDQQTGDALRPMGERAFPAELAEQAIHGGLQRFDALSRLAAAEPAAGQSRLADVRCSNDPIR